jgi:hypothetical protein
MAIALNAHRLATLAACCLFASAGWAAAPDDITVATPPPDLVAAPAALDYALETEMTVHNWVLCVSAPQAKQLARARAWSIDDARSAYVDLASARSCGQFAELRVILHKRLFAAADGSGHETRVFGGLVNLSGDWASAFLVSGSLPEN